MKTVLITGAAGDVGTHLRRELAGRYALRVSDLRPVRKFDKAERVMRADVSKFDDALRITKGVDAVVHLGGHSVEGPWKEILSANTRSWYDNSNARRLGYAPQDDSETFAAEVLARERPGDPTAELYQGGAFTVEEEIPNPAPLPRGAKKKRR